MEHIPPELRAIGELLRTQDNRCTDAPIFIVQQQVEHPCDEERDGRFESTRVVWYYTDGDGEVSELRASRLETLYRKRYRFATEEIPNQYGRCVMGMQYEYVTACFTEEGANQHIRTNGHNLCKPRVYADGSYRNFEFRIIRDWLMSLASIEEAKTAEPAILTALQSKMNTIAVQPGDKLQVTIPDGCPQDDAYRMGGLLHAIFGCEVIIVPSDVDVDVIREAKPLH